MRCGVPPALIAVCLTGVLGCENAGAGRVLDVEATGVVRGSAIFDEDGSGFVNQGDSPLEGVTVRLLVAGTADTIAVVTSDASGVYRVANLPVGRYALRIDSATVGDTVEVVTLDSTEVTVLPADSVRFSLIVAFPQVSVRELRALPTGTRVFVTGVALNSLATFGDSTVHLTDTSGTIRATRVLQAVAASDSVRFRGRRSTRGNQATLDNVQVFTLGLGTLAAAEPVTTGMAASADGGRLDAAMVVVSDATITDTVSTLENDYIVTADDGSGTVDIVFDANAALNRTPYVPGALVDVTGVLVPAGAVWRMKPRVNVDVVLK